MKPILWILPLIVASTVTSLCAEVPGYLEDAFRNVRWIAYSPTGNSSDLGSADAKDADKKRDEIRKDLAALHEAGFGGVVTYGCNGLKEEIPKLAQEAGIHHIIMGIYNPKNPEELTNAKAEAHLVDGYCIGNEGLGRENRYTLDDVLSCMREVRSWSGKPVTTSEQIDKYLQDNVPGLIDAGDWLFPNVHPWFHSQFDEPAASRWTKAQVDELKKKSKGKFIVCKEVGFPTGGDDDGRANEDLQGDYYVALQALDVPFVYFEAFDQVWKQQLPIEPHWGLFTKDRTPKKAVMMIMRGGAAESIQINSLRPGGQIKCVVGQDGGTIDISGSAKGIREDRTLLLFVRPEDPGVSGWFLQLNPQGVDLNADGTWTARGQIGNREWPPQKGMKIDLMIRGVPVKIANDLIETRNRDSQLRNSGIRSQDLPKADQEWIVEIKHLELNFN